MAQLTPGTPVTVPTPQLLVENRLAPGRYRFQLVVFDDAGQASAPATLEVTVVQPASPVLGPVGPIVRPVAGPGPIRVFQPNPILQRNPQ